MGLVTHSNVDDVFSYHKPKNDFQVEKYHRVRQGAKTAAKVMLDTTDTEARLAAVEALRECLVREGGHECNDMAEAMGLLDAATSFIKPGGLSAALRGIKGAESLELESETTQAVIQCIRSAVMWVNASVALEGRI